MIQFWVIIFFYLLWWGNIHIFQKHFFLQWERESTRIYRTTRVKIEWLSKVSNLAKKMNLEDWNYLIEIWNKVSASSRGSTRGVSGCGLFEDIHIRIHLQSGYGCHFFTLVNICIRIRIRKLGADTDMVKAISYTYPIRYPMLGAW